MTERHTPGGHTRPLPRPAESYLVNGVIVPQLIAAYLHRAVLRGIRRGWNADLDAVLEAFAAAAARRAARPAAEIGNAAMQTAATGSSSARRLTTSDAATRLGIAERTVRWRCATGRIPAEQDSARRWWLNEADVELAADARSA